MPDMETIRLFDTLSREVRDLPAGENGRFRLYVCGPTVYGPAHIGNFLTFLRFDVLYRLLCLCGYHPYYVRNITDVDDKTIQRSREAGLELAAFTREWTERFHEDCALLNMLSPDVEPRATGHITEQIQLVETLLERGHAYQGRDGSVYFRVGSFPDYGKLSHFDPEALRTQEVNSAGRANLADEYERDAIADFALWKASREADGGIAWESPWGRGRPGWHLECSAMSMKYLGKAFDLHGGGEDLCFPHHENEIAQSEALTGESFARHWMHSVHLLVEGKKMSKSLGNFFLLEDLLNKGFHPQEIRLALLGGHYRQQFNFTEAGLEAARSGLNKLESGVSALLELAGLGPQDWPSFVSEDIPADWGPFGNAWKAFRSDLNTPAVLGALFNGLKRARKLEKETAEDSLKALGCLLFGLGIELFARPGETREAEVPAEVRELAERRWRAKQEKAYAEADALRASLREKGWLVVDRPDGYTLSPETKV
ncbi:MAG: cysteine--tRNA ligase [Oceanipulchritudo sp.]